MSEVILLRDKLNNISRINQVTKAMQIVSAAQLKNIQDSQRAASHFKRHFDRLSKRLNVSVDVLSKKKDLVSLAYVFATERGFCGGFNENIIGTIPDFEKTQQKEGLKAEYVVIGGKGADEIRARGIDNVVSWVSSREKLGFKELSENAEKAFKIFRNGKASKIFIIYNEFKSMLVQQPVVKMVLPFDFSNIEATKENLLLEPSLAEIKEYIGLNYLKALFFDAFMQTKLGEVSSRLITMRGATENSKEMIDQFSIKINKARQAGITIELSEILSSFETLGEGE